MKIKNWYLVMAAIFFAVLPDCHNIPEDPEFRAYKASLQLEGDTVNEDGTVIPGGYIVDDDLVAVGDDNLLKYYLDYVLPLKRPAANSQFEQHNLIVGQTNGHDDKWSAKDRKSVTYCVSDKFASHKAAVVESMRVALAAWENVADVNYTHSAIEDFRCDAKNNNVTFDVRPTSGQSYLARSFFPSNARRDRNVLIDASAFKVKSPLTLAGILRHELGHTLGFRHEHTRPQAGTKCYEDSDWRALTTYDSASVMHYPQCNGTGDWALTLTVKDITGAQKLYGAAR